MKAYANSWLVAWALALISHMDGALALAGEPLDIVKSAGERVIAVLKDPKLKAPDKKKERVER
ncbi:MAG TPA: hypothetical protein VFQ89_08725, partial [Candidatus Binatia bacterium]|nr:hypothetical protein [Candidatus Binatia bacterium]